MGLLHDCTITSPINQFAALVRTFISAGHIAIVAGDKCIHHNADKCEIVGLQAARPAL